jgi:hypothetical protein
MMLFNRARLPGMRVITLCSTYGTPRDRLAPMYALTPRTGGDEGGKDGRRVRGKTPQANTGGNGGGECGIEVARLDGDQTNMRCKSRRRQR